MVRIDIYVIEDISKGNIFNLIRFLCWLLLLYSFVKILGVERFKNLLFYEYSIYLFYKLILYNFYRLLNLILYLNII